MYLRFPTKVKSATAESHSTHAASYETQRSSASSSRHRLTPNQPSHASTVWSPPFVQSQGYWDILVPSLTRLERNPDDHFVSGDTNEAYSCAAETDVEQNRAFSHPLPVLDHDGMDIQNVAQTWFDEFRKELHHALSAW